MKLWGMELNCLIKLRNRPGGLQSLWVCGVVLCVALGKLVVWNLWTGEARERRIKELLCNAYLRDNRVLLLRKAGVAGRKMLCEADGMSMLRGDIARDRIKVLNIVTGDEARRVDHVSSSLPSVTIRHTALQSHTFLSKGEPGGTVTVVG